MRTRAFVAAVLAGAWSAPARAFTLSGHITSITDGDTLDITTADKQTIRIRLAEIDAPERRQPFGTASKQALSDLAFDKQATVEVTDHDRYGRAIGLVRVGEVDVNAEMVRRGMAWVYLKYRHRPVLVEIEAEARKAKRGLWADPRAVAPWEWRAAKRKAQ